MQFKKAFYLCAFTILGGMIGFLLHAFIETLILAALLQSAFGDFVGLSYGEWAMVHGVATPLLVAIGLWAGFLQGRHWWEELYVKTYHRW